MAILSILLCEGLRPEMVSRVPTGLHKIAGKPLFLYPLDAMLALADIDRVLVVAPVIASVKENICDYIPEHVSFVEQDPAESSIGVISRILDTVAYEQVLIIEGERPLLTAPDIQNVMHDHISKECDVSVAVMRLDSSQSLGYENVIDGVSAAMYGKTAAGIYVFKSRRLSSLLNGLTERESNAQGLDAIVLSALSYNNACVIDIDQNVGISIRNRIDLANATRLMRMRINQSHMKAGVQFEDPDHTYVDNEVSIGIQTVIRPGCTIEGSSRIGRGCVIGPNAIIRDSSIGDQSVIGASVIETSSVGPGSLIGYGIHLISNTQV